MLLLQYSLSGPPLSALFDRSLPRRPAGFFFFNPTRRRRSSPPHTDLPSGGAFLRRQVWHRLFTALRDHERFVWGRLPACRCDGRLEACPTGPLVPRTEEGFVSWHFDPGCLWAAAPVTAGGRRQLP